MARHEVTIALAMGAAMMAVLTRPVPAEEVAASPMTVEKEVRQPAVAGQFYPARPSDLEAQVREFLARVPERRVQGRILGLVCPHAGYIYSGQVAAHAYKLLQGRKIEKVVVISPSHVEYFPFASVFPGEAYRTPLGTVPVDRQLAARIASQSERIQLSPRGHLQESLPRQEHALEVQLPFLQEVLGDFELVPIVMGDQKWEICRDLGQAVGRALEEPGVLVVASSDLSHFKDDATTRRLDGAFCDLLEKMDPRALQEALDSRTVEACGGGPVVAAMIAALEAGADRCEVLATATSGDVTGDRSSVVGYASAVFLGGREGASRSREVSEHRRAEQAGSESEHRLSPQERDYLLRLARYSIAQELGLDYPEPEPLSTPDLERKSGAFVTLKIGPNLRGCIGYIEALKPLARTVREMAKAAAFQDPRFPPLSREEFPRIRIEISVLGPLQPVGDPEQIQVGRHGLVIERGMNRGLLLPQVATEYHWDRWQFLEQTCRKAMLPPDAWRQEGTRIFMFTAEVFAEKD